MRGVERPISTRLVRFGFGVLCDALLGRCALRDIWSFLDDDERLIGAARHPCGRSRRDRDVLGASPSRSTMLTSVSSAAGRRRLGPRRSPRVASSRSPAGLNRDLLLAHVR